MVTHDLDSLNAVCDRIAVLLDKRVVVGTMEELLGLRSPLGPGIFPWTARAGRGPCSRSRSSV